MTEATESQLQRQISNLREMRSVVHTMKVLAAASIRQCEEAVRSLEDYYRTVELGLHVVLREMKQPTSRRPVGGSAVAVVFGSDRGFCGGFNREIAGYTSDRIHAPVESRDSWRILAVGARVAAALDEAGDSTEIVLDAPASVETLTDLAQRILLVVEKWLGEGESSCVHLFHGRHREGGESSPAMFQLLPVNFERFRHLEARPWPTKILPLLASPPAVHLEALLQEYFFVALHRAAAESLAAEQAERLGAMQVAERRIQERHNETLQQFRRRRQESISAEVSEVVSGYEALTEGERRG